MDKKKEIAQELARTISQFRRLGGAHGTFRGIRPSEFLLLATMKQIEQGSDGIRVSDLSAELDITPAGVTHMINALEEGGYVERKAAPSDRRVVLVKLTPKGQQVLKERHAKFLEHLTGLVDFLGERDSREFLRLLSLTQTYFKERRSKDAE